MFAPDLLRAWFLLLALSASTTVIAVLTGPDGLSGPALAWSGVALLILALAKARTILSRYLRLSQVPSVLRGFSVILALYLALLAALYLAPGFA